MHGNPHDYANHDAETDSGAEPWETPSHGVTIAEGARRGSGCRLVMLGSFPSSNVALIPSTGQT